MNIHSRKTSSPSYILVHGRTGGESIAIEEAPAAGRDPGTAIGRNALVVEAASDAIAAVTTGLNPRTEEFQRAVPRFKAEIARTVPDYTAQEMLTALALYLGERERQLAMLAALDRLAGRSGAEFLPKGTIRSIVQRAAEAGDGVAIELLANPRPPACIKP